MDRSALFLACRRGDCQKVEYLVEQRETNINVRDKWDSTPLYYACLCGHQDIVQYLLQRGAKCEANTFDGERCVYGALSDSIRNILKSYKVLTSYTIQRDAYGEFLRKLKDDRRFADIQFIVHNNRFLAHRCVLIARSPYFAAKFQDHWQHREVITIKHRLVNPDAFGVLLTYLYTGRLELAIEIYDDVVRLVKQCQLPELMDKLEAQLQEIISFESTKPGVNVKVLSIDPDDSALRRDFRFLAKNAIPTELCTSVQQEMPFPEERRLIVPDVCLVVDSHNFLCHLAFMCGRCEYFRALIDNMVDDIEWTSFDGVRVRRIQIKSVGLNVFVHVLNYIYQDSCDLHVEEEAFDLLYVAEMFLLPGLKRLCAGFLEQCLYHYNVIICLRMARLLNLGRLEDRCAEFIADNLHMMINTSEFTEMIQEDAMGVEDREETDSIDIIDQVRFHITSFVRSYSEIEEANEKLGEIDRLLESLDLEG